MAFVAQLDRLIGRVLLVPAPAEVPVVTSDSTGERAFGFSLVFSGVRCILQYAILPFVLPLVGVASDAAVPITMVLSLVAIGSMIASLRRFWRIDYKYKWQYLALAIPMLGILIGFLVLDFQSLGIIAP
jgi:ABC-type iron transport system FetAB permease component